MMPAGSMHSKLQLLKFPGYLRIVIPTGNLVPYDVSMFPQPFPQAELHAP